MPLNHSEAIARVTIDGLGVCCFNSREKKWDLAFLHVPDPPCHELVLTVECKDLLRPGETVQLISIETVKGQFPEGFPNGFRDEGPIADRKILPGTDAATENFRWVLDLEQDVPHRFVGLKKPPQSVSLTRVYIHNAVFYTEHISDNYLILVQDGENPNQMANPPLLGRTNDEIGADIFCDAGGQVIIRVNGEERFREAARPGKPWQIYLTNLCAVSPPLPQGATFGKGDFQNFYHVIEVEGPRYALWGKPGIPARPVAPHDEASAKGDPSNPPVIIGRPDCDSTRLGTIDTLDPMFT